MEIISKSCNQRQSEDMNVIRVEHYDYESSIDDGIPSETPKSRYSEIAENSQTLEDSFVYDPGVGDQSVGTTSILDPSLVCEVFCGSLQYGMNSDDIPESREEESLLTVKVLVR